MKNKDLLKTFKLDDLKLFVSLIEQFDNKDEMLNALFSEINRREKENKLSLNVRFDIKMIKRLNLFYPDELRVLEINKINNIQDLIDCDLDSLIGITESIKEKLEWARKFYDMSGLEDEKKTNKQKNKSKKQL